MDNEMYIKYKSDTKSKDIKDLNFVEKIKFKIIMLKECRETGEKNKNQK
jgi:hypothetical protein